MTLPEKPESGRSVEEIVQEFVANFELYVHYPDIAKEKIGKHPNMLFQYEPDQKNRERLVAATVAYYALPQSLGERKRLIDEVNKTPFLSKDARLALKDYLTLGARIRKECGVDWRDAVLSRLPDRHQENLRSALYQSKTEETMDTVMDVVPPPPNGDLLGMLKGLEHSDLFDKNMQTKIRTARANLEEFIVNKKK